MSSAMFCGVEKNDDLQPTDHHPPVTAKEGRGSVREEEMKPYVYNHAVPSRGAECHPQTEII